MKWKYVAVRSTNAQELDTALAAGYEPFFITVEDGRRYIHLRLWEDE